MKKIGILTYCKVANFGANLQALSTYYYLQNHGYNPIIIDWFPSDFEKRIIHENSSIQSKAHFDFVNSNMNFTRLCRTSQDVVQVIEEENIHGVIIGSDAVLQHTPFFARLRPSRKSLLVYLKIDSTRQFPNPFWADWISEKKIPTAIMSASNQGAKFYKYPKRTMRKMYQCLSQLSYISVRDEWTKKMIEYVTNGQINPLITPDPVFGLKYNCKDIIPSKEEIFDKFKITKPYVLVSFRTPLLINGLGKTWFEELQNIFMSHGKECLLLPMPNGIPIKYADMREITVPLSPIDWYALIQNADAYIGQNMHPIVSALSNGTPFFCFDDYASKKQDQKSKVADILDIFSVGDNKVNVYRHGNIYPTPEYIYEKINDFHLRYNTHQEQVYYSAYLEMMRSITSYFSKK